MYHIVSPILLFILGAVVQYAYNWIKNKLQADGAVGLSALEVNQLIQQQCEKCSAKFLTATDLHKLQTQIMDSTYDKFVTKEEGKRLSSSLQQLHIDVKEDFRDIKEQLTMINQYLMRINNG